MFQAPGGGGEGPHGQTVSNLSKRAEDLSSPKEVTMT